MSRKTRRIVNLALILAAVGAGTPVVHAADERVWTLSGVEEKKPDSIYLGYGVPETDDSFGGFSCKPGSGEVKLWISETSEKLKPGKSATAILSVDETRAKVAGKLMPNEEAGVPSFEGRLPANDPIFAALAGGETLAVAVGPSKQTAPLKGAAEKFRRFAEKCAKP
ncbi:hypothetical protein LG047_06450 [Methylocystis sp. WRRC1]|uniref:hypothetical protein n=1 Tax=Methylocystis sp. WRRC1 TaxID=1732014 RepID=UPI001D1540A5|nr:hypothetical protein [Methylocystis sp. WRRC1]